MSVESFEREVLDRLIKIEAKLESWDKSKAQVYDNQRDIIKLQQQNLQQQDDINELKDNSKWLKRTTVGAAIAAIVSTLVAVITAAF